MQAHTRDELQVLQRLPLEEKLRMTKMRIVQWLKFWDYECYVSFSGGKDSCVLLHICRQIFPEIDAVFFNTGIEYPQIVEFVRNTENVTIIQPKQSFREVVCEYGYPMFSKETSEAVWGARRYLTSLMEDENVMAGRQAGRQAGRRHPYAQWYRKVAGIGEYSKRQDGKQEGRFQSEACANVGDADKGQESSDKGEYP